MTGSGGILGDLLARVTDVGRSLARVGDAPAATTPAALAALAEDLLAGRGEATGLALAREILTRYRALPPAAKPGFFREMRARFGVDEARMARALAAWQERGDDTSARTLHYACEPRSQELLRMLNRTPGGTAVLVAMRDDLIRAARDDADLRPLDEDFRHLFASWFNRGFLELRQIDWSTSAAVLEKIIAYEAVHEIQDWDDLRRRVAAPDRRLYGFFHPALPGEPLIFVEVALTDAIPGAIGPILARERAPLDPAKATVAVFYSISNCQTGLRGISFGNFLIKQVVEELGRDAPAVKTFVTLSPVPGLRAWARETLAQGADGPLSEAHRRALHLLDPPDGMIDAEAAAAACDRLAEIAALYLVEGRDGRGQPADPVARFHLGNGARLERINTGADHSARGLKNGWGVMVNYLYDRETIEKNHEAYANSGTVICSTPVRRLLRQAQGGQR